MPTQEFDEILGSLQQIVKQAYALGRAEALKQVVDVLKGGEPEPKPLALMAPSEPSHAPADPPPAAKLPEPAPKLAPEAPPQPAYAAPTPMEAPHTTTTSGSVVEGPWWARPPRAAGTRA